ncbi:MAG TPA: thioredoxin, partial [Bacteroidia bacterium]|nr:thioredoxin [Bacteroidia bacterium]
NPFATYCDSAIMTAFFDSNVVNYMSQYFYAVKMDAESRDSVTFGDHTFTYMPDQKANELAISLLNGKMSYPTFVIMDENIKLLSPVAGYQTAPQMMPILKYFGDNIYLKQNWEEYSKTK